MFIKKKLSGVKEKHMVEQRLPMKLKMINIH